MAGEKQKKCGESAEKKRGKKRKRRGRSAKKRCGNAEGAQEIWVNAEKDAGGETEEAREKFGKSAEKCRKGV